MKIQFNNNSLETTAQTLEQLLRENTLDQKTGIAVAVNHEVISKHLWSDKKIQENDNILIITATQGG